MTELKCALTEIVFQTDLPQKAINILSGKCKLRDYLADYYKPQAMEAEKWKELLKVNKDFKQEVLTEYPSFSTDEFFWVNLEDFQALLKCDIKLIVSHIA